MSTLPVLVGKPYGSVNPFSTPLQVGGSTGSTGPAGEVSLSQPPDPQNWYKICDKCSDYRWCDGAVSPSNCVCVPLGAPPAPFTCRSPVWWKKGFPDGDNNIKKNYTFLPRFNAYIQKDMCPIGPINGCCPNGYKKGQRGCCGPCPPGQPCPECACQETCEPVQHGGAGNNGGHGNRFCVDNVDCIMGYRWSPTACKCVRKGPKDDGDGCPPGMVVNPEAIKWGANCAKWKAAHPGLPSGCDTEPPPLGCIPARKCTMGDCTLPGDIGMMQQMMGMGMDMDKMKMMMMQAGTPQALISQILAFITALFAQITMLIQSLFMKK